MDRNAAAEAGAARRDPLLVVLGLGLLAVATHAGYYSRSHGSESLVFGLVAGLFWFALGARRLGFAELVSIGRLLSLVLIVRVQYVIYALPVLVRVALTLWRAPWRGRRLRAAMALGSPCSRPSRRWRWSTAG